MRRLAVQSALLALACTLVVAPGISGGAATHGGNVAQLFGKRVPGAPTSWATIQPFPYTCLPGRFPQCPVYARQDGATESLLNANFASVQFYEFASVSQAKDYYRQPGSNLAANVAFLRPLTGPAPEPEPSRWIDLEQCLYLRGPNPNDAPIGAPASDMTLSGNCPIGTAVPVGLAAMARIGNDVIVVNNPAGTAGYGTMTIPMSVREVPAALALQVAGLLRHATRELQSTATQSSSPRSSGRELNVGAARFALTGALHGSWVANVCQVLSGSGLGRPLPGNTDVTVLLQDFSAPGSLSVQFPRAGGKFSIAHSTASVAVQLLDDSQGWDAASPQQTGRTVGSGSVTASANARSGSLDITLSPLDLNLAHVDNAVHDLHIVGSWKGCSTSGSSSTSG